MIVWSDNQLAQGSEGYGYVQQSLYPFLEKSGLPIRRIIPKSWDYSGLYQFSSDIPPLLRLGVGYMEKENCANEIIINHSTPSLFEKSNIYSIGFTYWETNRLPLDWVSSCNRMDEIWTCGKEMKKVFINSGVTKPVYHFDLGVDPLIFSPELRTPHPTFTFLSIGSPSGRKNTQMVIDAFLRLYDGDLDYCLIYKTNGPPVGRLTINGEIHPLVHPQIKVISDDVSHERLGEIYDMADCLIYPTSGEGWGLIPYQAISKGLPTICTDALGSTEYSQMSVPLNFKWGTSNMYGIYSKAGQWAIPDFDDLCDKMRYVVAHFTKVAAKTYESAVFINKNKTWEEVSKQYINRIKSILLQTK